MDNPILWLYLLLAGFGDSPCDLLSFLEPDDYFQARHVAVTPEAMEALATKEPADTRAEGARLLAIRWLGEHKVEEARETLLRLARGPNAADRLGFAQEYARRSLAHLDGRPFRRGPSAANYLRQGLDWFPSETVSVAALDLSVAWADMPLTVKGFGGLTALREASPRETRGSDRGQPDAPAGPAAADIRPDFVLNPTTMIRLFGGREELSRWVDRFGNVELTRIACAELPPTRPGGKRPRLVRLTGRGDHGALVEFFRLAPDLDIVTWERRPGNEPITVLRGQEGQPAVAVIGNTDVVLAAAPESPGAEMAALDEALGVRARRWGGILLGPLARDLAEIPERASGLLAGELTEEESEELAKHSGLPAPPRHLLLHATVDETGSVDLRFRGRARTAGEAGDFVEGVRQWRDRQKAALTELGEAEQLEPLTKALNSIRVEADGTAVSGQAQISGDVPAALGEVLPAALQALFAAAVASALKDLYALLALLGHISFYSILGLMGLVVTCRAVFLVAMWRRGARRPA